MRRITKILSRRTLFLPTRTFVVPCSTGPFCCAWVCIVLLHAAHGAVLLRAVYSQVWTLLSPDEVDTNLRLTGKRFRPSMFYVAVALEVIASGYHVAVILSLIRYSIQARKLSLVDPNPGAKAPGRLWSRSLRAMSNLFDRKFARMSSQVRHWTYLYGIRGPYFERAFHAKELYETFWESIQLYECLYHVAHAGVGWLALSVLVLNCWTTPYIYRIFPLASHRAARFVLCLIVDAVIDFISSIIIPFTVYLHYRSLLAEPRAHDAAWSFVVSTDLLQFTPTDLKGILARLVPTTSMVMNLRAIKPVIERDEDANRDGGPTSQILPNPVTAASKPIAVRPKPLPNKAARQPRWIRVIHMLLFLWGLAGVVMVNVRTYDAGGRGVSNCRVVMRHWIVPRVPCAVLEVHCDDEDEDFSVLGSIDSTALRALTFANCKSLIMPDTIRTFSNLNWVEVRNSTLVKWPRSATLTGQTSPSIGRLIFVETNFTEFPLALYADASAFPPTLLDITFSETNITDLPTELDQVWPQPMTTVHFENGFLRSVPVALQKMDVNILSLAGNEITSIPEALFDGKTFTVVSLSNNPIDHLPPTLTEPPSLRRLQFSTSPQGIWLVGTNISSLPEWMKLLPNSSRTCLRGEVVADRSPLCTNSASLQTGCEQTASLRCASSSQLPSAISPDGYLFLRS